MSEEPDKTGDDAEVEATPTPEAAAPEATEPEVVADDPETPVVDEPAEEATSADDEAVLAESEDVLGEDEAEEAAAGEEAGEDAPKRRRRPSRRRAAAEAEVEEPKAPAPTRRRARRDPDEPAPVVRAQAKYVRSSARKARLVCDHIRGKSVEEARAILAVTPRAIARDWSKLLESAVANAEHNHELVGEDLYVKAVHADEGPTIKRFRPRAMGRATPIRKRTSHLTILLTPKD
jgi:ribosomal protein L22